MKLAIVGPSRCGKDETAKALASFGVLRYSNYCTSMVILPHAARALGIDKQTAWETRHQHRPLWRKIGDDLRKHDAAYLAREVLREQDFAVGIRSRREMIATQEQGLVDLTIWVDRDVPPDETLEFDESLADVVIPNRDDLTALHARLSRLARALGIHHPPSVEIDRASRGPRWESLRALA